jgi:hypothetical protein
VSFPERASTTLASSLSPAADAAPTAGPAPGWMRTLSNHYHGTRLRHPAVELCVVFDIDGTILDMRHLVVHVLLGYDRTHDTDHFRGLVADDIAHHEDDVDQLLASLGVPSDIRADVAAHYRASLWDREALLAASRPFEGVLGVIRWFQLQPRTHVVLNTGRPHHMRAATLESLNAIGAAYRVGFGPELLCTADEDGHVPTAKASVIAELRERGLRVVAAVDNEPENLLAMAAVDPAGEILFLHADTIFTSQRRPHGRVVAGREYHLRELVSEHALPARVSFVWHGVNDELNLGRFLTSDVRWAEVDVRRDPVGRLVLRHDGFDRRPWRRDEPTVQAEDVVTRLVDSGRSVKLDLKENGPTLQGVVELVDRLGLDDERLWWNAELPAIDREGFVSLRERFPHATISCPVDFLVPLLLSSSASQALDVVRACGISRLSFRWDPAVRRILDDVEQDGWEVNIYGVPDLESFLEASLLLPTSVTADFNFPEWRYFGRGSGEDGRTLDV